MGGEGGVGGREGGRGGREGREGREGGRVGGKLETSTNYLTTGTAFVAMCTVMFMCTR